MKCIVPGVQLTRACLLGCGAALVLTAAGCNGASQTNGPSTASGNGAGGAAQDGRLEQMRSSLDEQNVVGPTAADRLGYRIAWNIPTNVPAGLHVTNTAIIGDSIFSIDSTNTLSRTTRDSGRRIWQWPVGSQIDKIHGINRTILGGVDTVIVTSETNVHLFDASNGVLMNQHRLSQVASTSPLLSGGSLIYGTIAGNLVWYNYAFGSEVAGYGLNGAITAAPQIIDNTVVVATDRGQVMALTARQPLQIWNRNAQASIQVAPTIGPGVVYVASEDQHLYAFSLADGRTVWRAVHSVPLQSRPTYLENRVYQFVPSVGMVCYDAFSPGRLEGTMLWTQPDLQGEILAASDGRILVWHADSRTLSIADQATGDVIESVSLPRVRHLLMDDSAGREIYAVGDRGGITRLIRRN